MAVWDLNSNLDVFSMQTFLRGLIYVRWAIQAPWSIVALWVEVWQIIITIFTCFSLWLLPSIYVRAIFAFPIYLSIVGPLSKLNLLKYEHIIYENRIEKKNQKFVWLKVASINMETRQFGTCWKRQFGTKTFRHPLKMHGDTSDFFRSASKSDWYFFCYLFIELLLTDLCQR
jgi:hypothetical protein